MGILEYAKPEVCVLKGRCSMSIALMLYSHDRFLLWEGQIFLNNAGDDPSLSGVSDCLVVWVDSTFHSTNRTHWDSIVLKAGNVEEGVLKRVAQTFDTSLYFSITTWSTKS